MGIRLTGTDPADDSSAVGFGFLKGIIGTVQDWAAQFNGALATPSSAGIATKTASGIVQLAAIADAQAGVDDAKALTAADLAGSGVDGVLQLGTGYAYFQTQGDWVTTLRRSPNGHVDLSFGVQRSGANIAAGDKPFTLPTGFQPLHVTAFVVALYGTAGWNGAASVQINPASSTADKGVLVVNWLSTTATNLFGSTSFQAA